jgi:hypothetical protein
MRKTFLSILIMISILLTCFVNTYAAANVKLTLELNVGSTSAKINSIVSKVEKPYVVNQTIMLPLEWFTTAVGAEVNKKTSKVTEIIYGEMNAEITTGSLNYTVNSETKKLTVPPAVKNTKLMVPLDFISKNFPVTVTSDIKKGTVKIVLEDDGALSDLSFLTGGISSPKVGNSFYGWSLGVPSGSRIISNSFKSDKVGITNESRSLYFEISVENKKGRTLNELYNNVLYSSTIRSSKIDLKAAVPYFQYTRLSEYDEALRVKVFDKGDYFYYLTINCYDNSVTPEKLVTDKYYENIMSSFSLNYKGAVKGVEDISKVRQDRASYYNYIALNLNSKYLPWSINVPANWDKVLASDDPMTTSLGIDNTHYMKVTMNSIGNAGSLDTYVDSIKGRYDKYFNPAIYTFISDDYTTVAGTKARNLKFSIKQADKVYIMDELYFTKDDFVYEITVKIPEGEYDKLIKQFYDTLDQMTFYTFDEEKFKSDFEKYDTRNQGIRVSQQDDLFEYINNSYKWSVKLPGYWTKSGAEDGSSVTFENPDTGASVMVYAVENSSITKSLTDEEKFSVMRAIKKVYNTSPVQGTINDKGYQIRTYTYKVQSTDNDFFANITCYCFDAGNYTYCYLSIIPDLTAKDEAVKEVNDIWKSFAITKK